MKAQAQFQNTGAIELAVTVTMPVAEWKYVLRDLKPDSSPATDFARIVRAAVTMAEDRMEVSNNDTAT